MRTMILFGLALICVSSAGSDAAPADPNDSKTIDSFVKCLNATGNKNASVADMIDACIPDNCMMTLTMSTQSTQKACTLGTCKLPRVIFDCTEMKDGNVKNMLRPSLLLCPTDSKFDGEFGVNRIEVGEDVPPPPKSTQKIMRMADVKIPPGTDVTDTSKINTDTVTSKTPDPDKGRSNKGCNAGCHGGLGLMATADGAILSGPINPMTFKGKDLKDLILRNTELDGPNGICACITKNKDQIIKEAMDAAISAKLGDGNVVKPIAGMLDPNPNAKPSVDMIEAICNKLVKKKVCGRLPDMPGVACAAVAGGGKFLDANRTVSTLQLDVSGNAFVQTATSFSFLDLRGDLNAYSYLTRTMITSVNLDTLTGTSSGGDLENGSILRVSGTGSALVITPASPSGLPTRITFDSERNGSMVTFSIRRAVDGVLLAGGAGEPAFPERTALEFVNDVP